MFCQNPTFVQFKAVVDPSSPILTPDTELNKALAQVTLHPEEERKIDQLAQAIIPTSLTTIESLSDSLLGIVASYLPEKMCSLAHLIPRLQTSENYLCQASARPSELATKYIQKTASLKNDTLFLPDTLMKVKDEVYDLDCSNLHCTLEFIENLYLHFPHLKSLKLSHYTLDSSFFENLVRWKDLEDLSISHCTPQHDYTSLQPLSKLTHLKSLNLGYYKYLINLDFIQNLLKLENLNLDNAFKLDLSDIAHLATLPSLKTVSFAHCINIEDNWLQLLTASQTLESINFYHCSRITDAGVKNLLQLVTLLHLDLTGCNISDLGIKYLSRHAALQSLTISDCGNLTIESIKCLLCLETLHTLTIMDSAGISDVWLEEIARISSLKIINLEGSKGFSEEGIAFLRRALPHCRVTI
ncbi:MAG: hypothetical protein JWO53_291 [Chlamydiia bacterium]|nr:hypothetical protein [Chlamydiia bacterium]